jgi:DNA invertase Pin-like site-specific DNA recombinase
VLRVPRQTSWSLRAQLVFEEKRGAVKNRPALAKAIDALKPGSVLVVYKVDRLTRSLSMASLSR